MLSNKNNIFNVTAIDPSNVQNSSIKKSFQQIQKYQSIISVKPGDLTSPFIFTEPETNKAMMMVGVTPDDLIKMTYFEKQKIPGTPQMQQRIYNELENRRIKTFESIVEARKKIIQETKNSTSTKNQTKPKKAKIINYERLKQKQINSLIEYQNKANQLKQTYDEISQRLKRKTKSKKAEIYQKRHQNQIKMKNHLLRSLQPTNTAKEEIDNLIALREQERETEQNQLKEMQNSLSKLPKRQKKQNLEEIEAFKTQINENEANFNIQLEKLKNPTNSFNQELVTLINSQSNKNARLEYRNKERERFLFNQERQKIMDEQKAKLEKQLLEKESKIEANLRLISTQKIQHIHETQAIIKKRSQSAACTKKMLEEQKMEKLKKAIQKQEEAVQRANALKQNKNTELLEKAGKRWLKQKYGADYVKKLQIQKQFQSIEKVEKAIKKQENLIKEKEEIEVQEIHEYRVTTIKKLKKQKEYDDLKKDIQYDPTTDPYQLAQKYKVDIKKLKKPIASID